MHILDIYMIYIIYTIYIIYIYTHHHHQESSQLVLARGQTLHFLAPVWQLLPDLRWFWWVLAVVSWSRTTELVAKIA